MAKDQALFNNNYPFQQFAVVVNPNSSLGLQTTNQINNRQIAPFNNAQNQFNTDNTSLSVNFGRSNSLGSNISVNSLSNVGAEMGSATARHVHQSAQYFPRPDQPADVIDLTLSPDMRQQIPSPTDGMPPQIKNYAFNTGNQNNFSDLLASPFANVSIPVGTQYSAIQRPAVMNLPQTRSIQPYINPANFFQPTTSSNTHFRPNAPQHGELLAKVVLVN